MSLARCVSRKKGAHMKIKQLLVLIGVFVVLAFARLVCNELAGKRLSEPSPVTQPTTSGKMSPREIHKFIKDLRQHCPHYWAEAKKRADDMRSNGWTVPCPICKTELSLLHVFPQLTSNVDAMIDTDWHVKCGNCNHEDLFTIIHQKQ